MSGLFDRKWLYVNKRASVLDQFMVTENKVLKAGVMGFPIAHSRSPKLHAYWLRKYNIEGSYTSLAVEPVHLQQNLKSLKSLGFSGVNLTIPHKEAALKIVDLLEPEAAAIGAVNLILVKEDGRLEGRNTDVFGFTQNLISHQIDVAGRVCVILGAGGAARAAVAGLRQMKAGPLRLINRNMDRAEQLRRALGDDIELYSWAEAPQALRDAGLLINSTSLGMQGSAPLQLSLDLLPLTAAVTDLVYTPLMTDLLLRAQNRGHRIVTGLGMLLHQARPSFEAFFGKDPSVTEELFSYMSAQA